MLENNEIDEDLTKTGSIDRNWGSSFTLGGVEYATSLFWQPMQNYSEYQKEIKEAASSILEGADLFCIKGGKTPQFGICVSFEGFKQGETVAATAMLSSLNGKSSFVGVFKVNEGWWYICVRNDIVLSDGDMLYLKEEDAKEQFMAMMAVPDWDAKFAPAEWNVPETEVGALEDLLSRGEKIRLQKINALRGVKLVLVVAGIALVGIWLATSLFDKLFLSPPKRPVVVPIKPKVAAKVPVKEIPKPWENVQDPRQFAVSCFNGTIKLVEIMPPGWKIGNILCDTSSISTSWKKDIGLLFWADEALKNSGLNFKSYNIDASGTGIVASINHSEIETKKTPPEISSHELRNLLNHKFQSLGLKVSLADVVQTVSAAPQPASTMKGPMAPKAPIAQPVIIKKLKFSFSSTHEPMIWLDLLTKYSALEFTMITYSPSNNSWKYEGHFYVL